VSLPAHLTIPPHTGTILRAGQLLCSDCDTGECEACEEARSHRVDEPSAAAVRFGRLAAFDLHGDGE